ncbi:MAG: 4-hydroxy-tetrahydrodipicolinate reductase [Actinomycetia bacterium]|nr:4-hydroxy-tetrahydrodipicolinate reductase [Actinomycetes bacterium]MCP5033805.1 4-hydroxy-tetrahydrodipicolinate reductase [Actinomycetes bacterium]
MTLRVGVMGAGGRMGQVVCQAISAEDDLALVAGIDPNFAGTDIGEVAGVEAGAFAVTADNEALVASGVEVVVDFTYPAAARANLEFCAAQGIHAVVGTSGFAAADYEEIARSFTRSNCLIAPNFAIGAVLMIRFAEMAAPYFDTAEIIELHHDGKVDAPSGTAVSTAERMAAASAEWAPDPTKTETIVGARGASGPAGIPVHSVRMRGMTAHQEVLLGTTGQTLTLRHDSFDRSSFMPGVILAVHRIDSTPGLTVGLDGLLDL